MATVEAAERRVHELRALLAAMRAARADLRSLHPPTSTVGAAGSWTGTAANRLHHNELVPLTDRLSEGLDRAEQAVLDDLQHAQRTLDHAGDKQDAAERTAS